jgi:hypothetical protein
LNSLGPERWIVKGPAVRPSAVEREFFLHGTTEISCCWFGADPRR